MKLSFDVLKPCLYPCCSQFTSVYARGVTFTYPCTVVHFILVLIEANGTDLFLD